MKVYYSVLLWLHFPYHIGVIKQIFAHPVTAEVDTDLGIS